MSYLENRLIHLLSTDSYLAPFSDQIRHRLEHIEETAKIVSKVSPDYLGALNLHLDDGLHNEFMTKFNEPFEF